MDGINFLTDKFTPRQLPNIYEPRPELLNAFHKAANKRLILVSAPAGYGKTVSTLLWLKESCRKTIWIGLDSYDNSPSVFYRQFCTGILSVQPENENMANILRNPAFSSSPVDFTISLLSEYRPDDSLYALVLDDTHLIMNEEIKKSFLFVLKRLPNSFVTLFLTRNLPPDYIIEMIEDGRATTINAEQLLLSEYEIRKYFGRMGWYLTAGKAQEVHAITGGWAIAVAALAKSGQIELGQSNGQVLDRYIEKQIWDKWDDTLKNFMVKTAVVDKMSPALCESLTGCTDSQDILEHLYQSNSFVSHLGGDSYSYHNLFLEFLRSRLQESGIAMKELYKKAMQYYMDRKEFLIAMEFAVLCEDADSIVEIHYELYYGDQHLGTFDESTRATRLFFEIPLESICDQYPILYTLHFLYYYLSGYAGKAAYYLDKLYHHLPAIKENFPQFFELVIVTVGLDFRRDFAGHIARFEPLSHSIELQEYHQRTTITLQLPFMHRGVRGYHELTDEAVMERWKASRRPLLKGTYEFLVNGIACGLLYEQNRLKEALEIALLSYNTIDDKLSDEIYYAVFMHLSAIYRALGLGNDKQAEAILTEVEHMIEKRGAHYLRPNLLAYKAKCLLAEGNKAIANEWLDHYFVTDTEHLELYKIFRHFTTARAYIVLGQTDKAMDYIQKLKQLGTDFRRLLDVAEAGVLQAILEWAMGKREQAQRTLEDVLTELQPYGFIRVIADEGAAILPVLKRIAAKSVKEGYQGGLDPRYLNNVHLAVYEQSKRYKGVAMNINAKPVKLSRQQKYMLTLLAQGYKHLQIAQLTGLNISTVKTHVYIAFHKLNVDNAMDAVLRAKELGFLE